MKKFILRFVLFTSFVLAVLVFVDMSISAKLKATQGPEGEVALWNDIFSGVIDADIAIYGSSRAWVHIDPIILEEVLDLSAYNFGLDGHNFWLQYLRHKKYRAHNPTPKIIVVSVDVFSFTKRNDLYLSEQFLPFMLWDSDIYEFTSSYEGFTTFDYYIPGLRYAGKRHLLGNKHDIKLDKPLRRKGYRSVDKQWNNDFEKAQETKTDFVLSIDQQSVELFEQFIQECQLEDVQLILVYTPEHVLGQKFVKNRSEIFNLLKTMSEKYELDFLDYSNDSINDKKEYFYNASHLNKKGSQLFSRQLGADLQPLISIKEQ